MVHCAPAVAASSLVLQSRWRRFGDGVLKQNEESQAVDPSATVVNMLLRYRYRRRRRRRSAVAFAAAAAEVPRNCFATADNTVEQHCRGL